MAEDGKCFSESTCNMNRMYLQYEHFTITKNADRVVQRVVIKLMPYLICLRSEFGIKFIDLFFE